MKMIITFIMIILSVAFFTLLERKGLGYMQNRKGPNKVGMMGLIQPISDAMKLLTKQITFPSNANWISFLMGPCLLLMLSLMTWILYPSTFMFMNMKVGIFFFLCVSSVSIYGLLLSGWGSNSKYSMLGAIRGSAQTISYEVSMALILIFFLFILSSFNLKMMNSYFIITIFMPTVILWFISCLAETNRSPFDFAEGESELVSGFNIEYGAVSFTLIFLAEYMMILFMSTLTSLFFGIYLDFPLYLCSIFIAFFIIWVRGSLPRTRYDFLMNLTWKIFLPIILSLLLISLSLSKNSMLAFRLKI